MAALDLDAIRQANPLSAVVGRSVKLVRVAGGWMGRCPFHDDRTPSFHIYADDRRFRCFGGSCGVHGDVLDFVQLTDNVDLRGAAQLLAPGDWTAPVQPAAPSRATSSDRSEAALSIWRDAVPAAGTLAERYLSTRGLTIAMPDCIRFARLRYPGGERLPAMVAAVADVSGKVVAIQRTFLASDGSGKASVPTAKMSLGPVRGNAIHLTPAAETLVITEGFEDGATIHQATNAAVWIAVGAGMMPSMALPDIVRVVVIGADRDQAGEDAARQAARAIAATGRTARIMRPPEGVKDFNAQLMGGAA
jgi:DNA primase